LENKTPNREFMVKILQLLLPAIIPSWRFFDIIAPSPRIEILLFDARLEKSENWIEFHPQPSHISIPQTILRLFWNPERNHSLFMASCAERIAQNNCTHAKQDIRNAIRNQHKDSNKTHLQFRLIFIYRDQCETIYTSSVYEMDEQS
jgi:hypothetical protein